MARDSFSGLLSLLDHQQSGRLTTEQLLGLLSLYALLSIVDYLHHAAGLAKSPVAEAMAKESVLKTALAAVMGNSENQTTSELASLARSLGKNPAAIMSLVNLLAPEKPGDKKGKA